MAQDLAGRVSREPNGSPRLALLLCADEEVRDLAGFWLTGAGLRVISAGDGGEAGQQILDKPVAVLVIDTLPIYLPGLPSLRELKERRNLRVVFIPQYDEKPEAGVARIAGVDAVLARPLRKEMLLSALNAP